MGKIMKNLTIDDIVIFDDKKEAIQTLTDTSFTARNAVF